MKRLLLLLAFISALFTFGCVGAPAQYSVPNTGEIIYKTADGEQLGLDILYPTKRVYRKNPTVLVLHGGGWIAGEREDFLREFQLLCDELRGNGVMVVAVSYRKAINGRSWRDCLDDCEDALSYLVDNADKYDIDADRISVAGYSAGAQLAMMTAIETESQVKYCVSMSGPTYFTSERDSLYYSETLDYYNGMIFSKENWIDMYKASPLIRINRKCGSGFLLISGTSDRVITAAHAESFYREAQSFGLSVELMELDGLTHSYPAYGDFDSLCREIARRICGSLCD